MPYSSQHSFPRPPSAKEALFQRSLVQAGSRSLGCTWRSWVSRDAFRGGQNIPKNTADLPTSALFWFFNAVIPKILGDSWVSAKKSLLGGAALSFFESLGATKVHKIGALPSLHCAKMACTGASKKISTVSRSGGRSQPAWRKYAKKMALLPWASPLGPLTPFLHIYIYMHIDDLRWSSK